MSYINNLHPAKYKHLYSIIEKIIDHAIPLWNMSLFPLKDDNGLDINLRIPYEEQEFDRIPEPVDSETGSVLELREQEEGETIDDYEDFRHEWEHEHRHSFRRVRQPNPGKFEPPHSPDVSVSNSFYINIHIQTSYLTRI